MRSSSAAQLPLHRRVWQARQHLGRRLGDAQARWVLSVADFLVIAPFEPVIRFAMDPLALNPATPKGRRPRPTPTEPALERARRQG